VFEEERPHPLVRSTLVRRLPVLRVINCLSSVSLSRLPRNAPTATRLDQYCEVILHSGSGSRKIYSTQSILGVLLVGGPGVEECLELRLEPEVAGRGNRTVSGWLFTLSRDFCALQMLYDARRVVLHSFSK
jgi:hypothetical protein